MNLRLGAVVASAGLSRRMGREKVLLPWDGTSLVGRVLETLELAEIGERIVVLRPGLEEAGEKARSAGARVVWNPRPELGMLESFRIGIAALDPRTAAFFAWPADHPAVLLETVRLLAARADSRLAILPLFRGRRGHPALIGKDLVGSIETLSDDQGLRQLWRDRPEVVSEMSVADEGVLLDLDTPQEYESALRASPQRSRDGKGEGR